MQQQLTEKVGSYQREREETAVSHRTSLERMTHLHTQQIDAMQSEHVNSKRSRKMLFEGKQIQIANAVPQNVVW